MVKSVRGVWHVWVGRRVSSMRTWAQSLAVLSHDNAVAGTVEALLGCVLLTLIGCVVPQHWGLLDVQPHPLWLVVLAIGIRYGNVAGYVAGAAAAASYMAFLSVDPGMHVHLPPASGLLQPFLLLAGGVVITECSRWQLSRLAHMRQRYEAAEAASRSLAEREQALLTTNAQLQEQLLKQTLSPLTLYEVAKKFNVLRVDAIYPAILDVVSHVLEADACALYLKRDDHYQLHLGSPPGWPGRQEKLPTVSGVIARALSEGRVVSIQDRLLDEDPQAVISESALIAGLITDATGCAMGIVVVERMPFTKLNATNVQLFQALLEWASAALSHAQTHEALHWKTRTMHSHKRIRGNQQIHRQVSQVMSSDMARVEPRGMR